MIGRLPTRFELPPQNWHSHPCLLRRLSATETRFVLVSFRAFQFFRLGSSVSVRPSRFVPYWFVLVSFRPSRLVRLGSSVSLRPSPFVTYGFVPSRFVPSWFAEPSPPRQLRPGPRPPPPHPKGGGGVGKEDWRKGILHLLGTHRGS